jgi:hypothetical protein
VITSAFFLLGIALVPDRADLEIEASVKDDLGAIDLSVKERFVPGEALSAIPIVLPADRYRSPPPISPSEVRELYPVGFDRGRFKNVRVAIGGIECRAKKERLPDRARRLVCPYSAPAGQVIEVEISAELEVPERYGPFGRVGKEVTLGAGWYPHVARDLGPPRGAHRVRLSAPSELTIAIGETHFPSIGEAGRRTVEARIEDAAQVPLLLRPASARVVSIASGLARYLVGPGSVVQSDPREDLRIREVLSGIEDGLRFLQEEGIALPEKARPLILARAPLRHDLAQRAEGIVLVSDHAFRMPDVTRFLRFHRFPILREIFGELVARQLSDPDRALAADAIASWLLDRYVASRFGRAEDAFDVLGIVSFIPSIDSMLYAPDLPFVTAYFRVIREEDPNRPNLVSFPSPHPRGKLVYEKLVDRFGLERSGEVMRSTIDGLPFLESVRRSFEDERDAERFLAAWLGPYPNLQYRLVEHGSRPSPESCSGCWLATIVIERTGEVASEPIEVRLTDRTGAARIAVASATTAARRTLTATLSAELDLVELDPRGRLAETPSDAVPSPRYDNRSSHPWKVLLNNFNIVVAASEGAVDTAIDIGIQRRYDVHWSYAFRADYAQDAFGLSTRGSYAFGPRSTAARLSHFVGLGLAGEILRAGFAGSVSGGTALGISASYGYDDRRSLWAPETGTAVRLSAGYQRVFGADLSSTETTDESLSLSARAVQQWRIGLRHQIAVRASVSGYAFGKPRKQLLFALGGRSNIRGYAFDAELGRVRAVASAEWLHPLLPELETNGFYITWVSGIDGALFGDVGLIGDDLAEARAGPLFSDVGYGLRLYIDYFGVRPGVLALDFAFPLVRARGAAELGPPAIYIAFAQSFLGL